MFAAIRANEAGDAGALIAIARDFSPRLDIVGSQPPATVVLDLSGLTRLFGDVQTIASELHRAASARGLEIAVAIAGTQTAVRLLVASTKFLPSSSQRPRRLVARGEEAQALESLPLTVLHDVDETVDLATLRRWGLRTLGELAALPAAALSARLGQDGIRWQRLARGEDPQPLVPTLPEERFEQALDLEWPIEDLEPLSFVLGRLLEPLSAHLERRGRGAAVLRVRLHLVTKEIYDRTLQLPVAMRDARTLRTLALLDLESHPPAAAIDRVVVTADPTPARVVQFSLLTRPLPSPEQISTLNARLAALMGEGRCGSPVAVDSWRPGAFAMKPFAPESHRDAAWPVPGKNAPVIALRRFRVPVPARVRSEAGCPVRVITDRRGLSGGSVKSCAGPWRTSGAWWEDGWDRDEWDVTLGDAATYRIFRERHTDAWFIDGVVD
jgi:protein ImuB